MIELTKEYIDHLKDIITEKDDAKIKEILDELYPADIAELYQELDLQVAERTSERTDCQTLRGQYGDRRRCRPDA